jgi:hypothetical protein
MTAAPTRRGPGHTEAPAGPPSPARRMVRPPQTFFRKFEFGKVVAHFNIGAIGILSQTRATGAMRWCCSGGGGDWPRDGTQAEGAAGFCRAGWGY